MPKSFPSQGYKELSSLMQKYNKKLGLQYCSTKIFNIELWVLFFRNEPKENDFVILYPHYIITTFEFG